MQLRLPRAAEPRSGPPDHRSTSSPTSWRTSPGISDRKKHVPGPQGVRGRNSDNTQLREVLGWEPQISLEEGLARTYPWIEQQVALTAKVGLAVSAS